MISKKTKPKTMEEYVETAPEEARDKLHEMRDCLRGTAPGAEESLKWGKSAFYYDTILFLFSAAKHHIGFYVTPSTLDAFANDLSPYKTGKGSVQFPLEKPLPLPLIRKIATFRVREVKEKGILWKSI